MGFLELVHKRYSVRNYRDDPVAREAIERCIEAARLAPSACNAQPWKFVVVDEPALRRQLAAAAFEGLLKFNHFGFHAPVLVALVSDRQKAIARLGGAVKGKDFRQMDIGIAAEHFCLQAADEGLGACLLGWFNEKRVKKLLSIPASRRVELMITLGLPADTAAPARRRKSIDQVACYNEYA